MGESLEHTEAFHIQEDLPYEYGDCETTYFKLEKELDKIAEYMNGRKRVYDLRCRDAQKIYKKYNTKRWLY